MGVVLEALDRSGRTGDTLVVCTTDHGIAFPLMKCSLTDHGIGVMLILRGPDGGFLRGRVGDALVSHIDLVPTICELAGIPVPEWVRGRSLVPLIANPDAPVSEAVFAEVTYHASAEPMRAIRTTRYKYIRRFEVRPGPVLPNCDDSPSKNEMLRLGWDRVPQREEYFFDLVFDPHEACNRADDPACGLVLAEMRGRLERWMRETDDPLLTGPVTPWPGMVVNPPGDPSPQGPTVPAAPAGRCC
jgi:arylsulfatase A-like enzyme